MRFLLAMATLLAGTSIATAQDNSPGKYKITMKAAGHSEEEVIRAIEIFRQACQPLGGAYWSDVTEVRAVMAEEYAGYRLEKGWKTSLHLAISYAETPLSGPSHDDQAGVLSGQTLHYNLGGGHSPGFFASKRSSQVLCGLPVNANGDDVFVSLPELSFLGS